VLKERKKMMAREENERPHIPVLLDEVLESFADIEEGIVIDCTVGYAGHSREILEKYPDISVIGIDRDDEAVDFSRKQLAPYGERAEIVKGRFSDILPEILSERGERIRGILADFGVSSLQLDKMERGFSFGGGRLDMRMDRNSPLSAYEVVNGYDRQRLEDIFREYGEIRRARSLADAIVSIRSKKAIEDASELAEIAKKVLPSSKKIHPATLLFQAIRIEVNDELGEIERLLDILYRYRPAGALVSLITFHSLEDRLVKNRFREWEKSCICPPEAMRCECGGGHSLGRSVGRKPVVAKAEELRLNPRSRSAKLRSFRFHEERRR
jgi:16S rRNA (cytosine1402-N4)-methyltransferase